MLARQTDIDRINGHNVIAPPILFHHSLTGWTLLNLLCPDKFKECCILSLHTWSEVRLVLATAASPASTFLADGFSIVDAVWSDKG
jgi:hypothetical protein